MLGSSRTIPILARRNEKALDELWLPRFDGETIKQEDCIWLSVPALVFEIEVKEHIDTNNIFIATVSQLAKIKRSEIIDNGQLYDYIAEKTGLSRILVKSILQEENLHKDVESGEKKEDLVRKLKYLVFNPVSEMFFPRLLSPEEYDIATRAADVSLTGGDLSFRLTEAQGRKHACQLYTDAYSEDRTLRDPIHLLEHIPGLRYRLFKNNDIVYTGQCHRVNAICFLFRSSTDLTTLHISNPTNGDTVDAMLPSILNMAKKYSSENEELLNQIKSLDDDRKEQFEEIGDWNQQLDKAEQEVLYQYPKLFAFSPILRRVAVIYQSMQEDNGDNLIVAFHEFMEDILLYSLQHNKPADNEDEQWDEYIRRSMTLESATGDICDMLVGFADEIGLILSDEDRNVALNCFALRRSNKKKSSTNNSNQLKKPSLGYIRKSALIKALNDSDSITSEYANLPEFFAANIVQATVVPTHPFRQIRAECPDIIATIYYSMNYRQHAKHDDDEQRSLAEHLTYEVIDRTTNALLERVLKVPKLTKEEAVKEKGRQDSEQKAKKRAEDQIKLFPATTALNERHLFKVCKVFFHRKGNYFSRCYNLLDDVLSEILSEETELAQRKSIALGFFTGDRFKDVEKMETLFTEIGCAYQSSDRPDTGKIKKNWNSRTLTLKNKLFLTFATLKEYNPKFLAQLLDVAPNLATVVDTVCIKRGHNEQADFNENLEEYLRFHAEFLKCCEQVCVALRTERQEEKQP